MHRSRWIGPLTSTLALLALLLITIDHLLARTSGLTPLESIPEYAWQQTAQGDQS